MNSLEHAETGRYIVATESGSRYLYDFGRHIFVRLPKPGSELNVTMRGDSCQVQLLRLMECVVGRSMWPRINLNAPDVLCTDRRTSTVVAIVEVPDGIGGHELDSLVCELSLGSERVGAVAWVPTEEVRLDGDR